MNLRLEQRTGNWLIHPALIAILILSMAQLTPLILSLDNPSVPSPQQTLAEAFQGVSDSLEQGYGGMPLYFIANQGQTDGRVAYYIKGGDKTLYFTPEGMTLSLKSEGSRYVVKLDFLGANPVMPVGMASSAAKVSYFKGPPGQWLTGLPTYNQIAYQDLWPGIDLTYRGTTTSMKYQFLVKPGADPGLIRMAYRGAAITINESGNLRISTPAGELSDQAPLAYQESSGVRQPVSVAYALEGESAYGFQLGDYDPALPLVIDPEMLVYCGFIGGSGYFDKGFDIAVDQYGFAYVTGITDSDESTFPENVGPDVIFNGDADAFIAKVMPDGTSLVYAGYIGGDGWEEGHGVAVDASGNAYISGKTDSDETTFPVLVGPDLEYNDGRYDAFVAKVKADGTALDYCGYIGGSAEDVATGLDVDASGRAYISGTTESTQDSFPEVVGPDLTHNGYKDAFVARVNQEGSALEYCGYIGGNSGDDGLDVAVDAQNKAYITGFTFSQKSSFPVTVGPDLDHNGSDDTFVARVNASGTALDYCGYIGGSSWDHGESIAVGSDGSAYIAGWTASDESEGFPVLVGPDLLFNGGDLYDAYVAKVKADGTGLDYCGYIGGTSRDDYAYGIAVDGMGSAYVTGYTASTQTSFPVKVGPDLTHNGSLDAYVAKVETDGTGLVYCGYIGGNNWDQGEGIAVDGVGNAYLTGFTYSTEPSFPVKVGPDLTNNGSPDIYVAKLNAYPRYVFLPLVIKSSP